MDPRRARQILYSSLYIATLLLIAAGLYFLWFKPAPSCFDNRQNQGEVGVDCGGPCTACEIKTLLPFRASLRYFGDTADRTLVTAEIQNPNPNYGAADFTYTVNLYGPNNLLIRNIIGKSFIHSGKTKYLIESIEVNYRNIERAEIAFSNLQWKSKEEFAEPVIQIRDVKTAVSDQNQVITVSGFIANNNPFPLIKVRIVAFLANQLKIDISASKTELDNAAAFEEKFFSIFFPKDITLIQTPTSTSPVTAPRFSDADPEKTKVYVEAIR